LTAKELIKKLSPPKNVDSLFDIFNEINMGVPNIRSETEIYESMQDEFSFLVPIEIMLGMRPLKYESALAIT
jgi:hypothetical protein